MAAFKTITIVTNKVRGIVSDIALTTSLQIVDQVQQLQPRSTMIPTEMDLSFGLNSDITSDFTLEYFLSVVDIDNLPELASVRADNAWAAAQAWRVATGSFTIPTQTLEQADPRFFRPKAWANLEVGAAVRRMALCLLARSSGTPDQMSRGTIRYTEILEQRNFGDDNAYSDIEGNTDDFADDIGMQVY